MAHRTILELPPVEFQCRGLCKKDAKDSIGLLPDKIKVVPIIVNFHRVLTQQNSKAEILPGLPTRELYHVVAALYDQSLPDVTEDIIYAAIQEKYAQTILLVWDKEEAFEFLKAKAIFDSQNKNYEDGDVASLGRVKTEGKNENRSEETVFKESSVPNEMKTVACVDVEKVENKEITSEASKQEEGRFDRVFSDMEATDSEEEEDDEQYLEGVDEFLRNVTKRRKEKQHWLDAIKQHNCLGEPSTLVGIEHRLLACATFERAFKPGQKILQLTLIAVRKRFRKIGLGRFMTKIIRNPTISGKYDVIVVNADHSATDFFEKEGFTDDMLINSRYAEIGDTWFNCKRMCYLPPYQCTYESLDASQLAIPDVYLTALDELDLKQMDLDVMMFQEKSLLAFEAQASVIQRLRKEVILLRARVATQHDQIQLLTKENESIRDEKYACEKEFLKFKLATLTNAADKLYDVEDHSE